MISADHVLGDWLSWAGFDSIQWVLFEALLWYQAFLLGPGFLVVITILLGIRRARAAGARWRAIGAWAGIAAAGIAVICYGTGYADALVLARPQVIQAGPGAVAVAVSPDGKTLYAADAGSGASGSDNSGSDNSGGDNSAGDNNGGVTPVNLATGRAGERVEVGGPVGQLAVTPDGRTLYALVSAHSDATDLLDQLTPVDLPTGQVADPVRFPYGAWEMVPSPDGKDLYVLADTGRNSAAVIPVDIASGKEGTAIPMPSGSQDLAISPDGGTLYIGASHPQDRRAAEVIPVDSRSGKAGTPIGLPATVMGLAVSPDGRTLYAISDDAQSEDGQCTSSGPCGLSVIDVSTGAVRQLAGLRSQPMALAVAPGGRAVYILNTDETITRVNARTGESGRPIRTGDPRNPMDLDFAVATDGRTIYVADQGQGVAIVPVSSTN
jgi:DNA-binding beta-propeller fold protein YncE